MCPVHLIFTESNYGLKEVQTPAQTNEKKIRNYIFLYVFPSHIILTLFPAEISIVFHLIPVGQTFNLTVNVKVKVTGGVAVECGLGTLSHSKVKEKEAFHLGSKEV